MPKITVITPTYNSEATIEGTLQALLRQSFSDFEYIVVDGLSKDKTVEIIKSFVPQFEEKGVSVRIISEKDDGVYDAMNKGINHATGELIGITNSDDWYEDHTLEVMWKKYMSGTIDKTSTIIYGIERVWSGDKVYCIQRRGADFVGEGVMPHSTFFVPKEVYNRCGTFDLDVHILADYDFTCRCVSQGVKLEGLDVIIANFRLGGLSSSYGGFYSDFYALQLKYNHITKKRYKELMAKFRFNKLLSRIRKS